MDKPSRVKVGLHGEPRTATPSPTPVVRPPSLTGDPDYDAGLAMGVAFAADAKATRALDIAESIRDEVGTSPSDMHPKGGGALGVLFLRLREQDAATATVDGKIDKLSAELGLVAKDLADDRETRKAAETAHALARKEASAPWWRVWWVVLSAALAFLTVATLGGIGTAIVLHWH